MVVLSRLLTVKIEAGLAEAEFMLENLGFLGGDLSFHAYVVLI